MAKKKATPKGQGPQEKKSIRHKQSPRLKMLEALKADKEDLVREVLSELPPDQLIAKMDEIMARLRPQDVTEDMLATRIANDDDNRFSVPEYTGKSCPNQQRRLKLSKTYFLQIFRQNLANASLACKAARISYTAFHEWRRDDEEFREITESVKEMTLDFGESNLMWLLGQKENLHVKMQAVKFFLMTQGKKRGYIEEVKLPDLIDAGKVFVMRLPDNKRGGANIQEAEVIEVKALEKQG